MALLLNLCLVLFGLAGVSAAVGLPLTLTSRGRQTTSTASSSAGGGHLYGFSRAVGVSVR
ncbi:hypothetical protein [Candidatus Mycoplasma haematominutum]|uniref:Uncharacterized protein n=1 Tax=Candidatus Mycoplasma haematominutum 'Birmingham 1' TaxID=1116213 RepID=G8C3P3_9MOLU|nr:hypothetical protein [Candidatus Mycoplasma haematominutum]CCE66941.1 hypothetical protein MHM_04230 [Candidatus Mycoplasma haematominutum 'Birmingham 1']